ncbi:hypothetical protein D5R40_33115 [Okeania hirsuta]|uniref:Uncharacterized protein n=1 Tax=Okeania hirsuta TaxID=1458930 RepID=A0A3N6QYJ4_9CYAN|nr:hypothetical protein D5R40_33115 [Okeania hirsuta]
MRLSLQRQGSILLQPYEILDWLRGKAPKTCRMTSNSSIFNTHTKGKLLLTGEYVVLDGATALAIPAKLGQWMEIKTRRTNSSRAAKLGQL